MGALAMAVAQLISFWRRAGQRSRLGWIKRRITSAIHHKTHKGLPGNSFFGYKNLRGICIFKLVGLGRAVDDSRITTNSSGKASVEPLPKSWNRFLGRHILC